MPEDNKEQNLPEAEDEDEAAVTNWEKRSMPPYYTRLMADPTVAVARLHAYFQNNDASEGTET